MEKNFDMPTITKRMKASQSVVIVLKGEAIPTIADRGTSADIVSLDMAQQLVTEGVVDQIHEPLISVAIQFGIKTATGPVIGIIYGKGLLGNVYVVENGLATALISDITFTEKGVILVEDNVHLIGIAGGQIIFVGARDPTVPRTDSKAMWRLDIRALLLQEDPRIQMREIEQQHNQTAWDIINKLGIDTNTAQCGYQGMEQHRCYGAKPTFAIKDVRMGRAILKALGVSAFTLANSVERNAFKNIPLFLTAALLRAIGNDRGNIPSLLTTARKKALGGTGIRSTKEGECMSFDLEGKHPKSTWGCCFSGAFWDEYTRWGDGYGLNNKSDLRIAFIKYCQKVEMYGKGPVRMARVDAAAEVTKHGQLTAAFREVCAEFHIVVTASAPEDQATNPIERGWQTITHRMTAMLLQQDTLTKADWLLVWLAALVLDSVVCHAGESRSPYELMTGNVPDLAHAAEFYVGQKVMFPNTGTKQLMKPNFQFGVHIAPILANKAHLVLVGENRTPQVRSRVQSVGLELRSLSAEEWTKLQPTFDEAGVLIEFHSRAKLPFSMKRYMQDYDDGADLQEEEERMSDMARLEVDRWMGPAQSAPVQAVVQAESSTTTGLQSLIGALEAEVGDDPDIAVAKEGEELVAEEDTHEADTALLMYAMQAILTDLGLEDDMVVSGGQLNTAVAAQQRVQEAPEDVVVSGGQLNTAFAAQQRVQEAPEDMVVSGGQLNTAFTAQQRGQKDPEVLAKEVLKVFKARAIHTDKNPTQGMLERDAVLAEKWKESTHKEISGGILEGFRILLTEEEKVSQGWVELPLVMVYSVKRDGTYKCRAATNGMFEDVTWFDADDLFAEGLPPAVLRLMTAFGAYFGMIDVSADVVQCFAQLNTWDKSKYPRLICHRLTTYQSPTGEEAWMGNLTNNNGSRDASGQWRMVSCEALVNRCGLTQSRVCRQVFFKLEGEDGLLLVGQITDDFKVLFTNNASGHELKRQLFKVLTEDLQWKMTHQEPTLDYGSIKHEFAVIGGKKAVTLTQEMQVVKVAELVYGPKLEGLPEVYLPLPREWSMVESAMCTELVDQRHFMKILMCAAWAGHTHFESSAVALLACTAQRPTVLSLRAVEHYVAYLYGKKHLGVTYVMGPEGSNMRKTVPLRLFTDTGENQHLNGAGHLGVAVYLGLEEIDSGAVLAISQKARGVVGESVPVNEITGAAAGVKAVMVLKFLLEEWSGATQTNLSTTAMVLEDSAAPIVCGVPEMVVQAVHNTEVGHLGDAAQYAAAIALSNRPPVNVYGDNQGVVDNINHIRHNSTGLRRVTRMVAHLQSLVEEDVIRVFKVASAEQIADTLSKQCVSPVRNALALERLLGKHPDVTAYVERVQLKCNKRGLWRKDTEQEQADEAGEVMGAFTAHVQIPEDIQTAIERMKGSVQFLQSSSGKAAMIMARMGYHGHGGLGPTGAGGEKPLSVSRKHDRKGVGCYGNGHGNQGGAFVASVKEVQQAYLATAVDIQNNTSGSLLSQRVKTALLKMVPDERLLFRQRLAAGPFQDLLVEANGQVESEEVFIAERMRRALIKLTKEERWLFSTELRGQPFIDRFIVDEEVFSLQRKTDEPRSSPVEHQRQGKSGGHRGSKGQKWKNRRRI